MKSYTKDNRFDHSVMGICSTLHSFAKGTLQVDPASMRPLYDWLSWRTMQAWDETPKDVFGYAFDVWLWNLCKHTLNECVERFGWPLPKL